MSVTQPKPFRSLIPYTDPGIPLLDKRVVPRQILPLRQFASTLQPHPAAAYTAITVSTRMLHGSSYS